MVHIYKYLVFVLTCLFFCLSILDSFFFSFFFYAEYFVLFVSQEMLFQRTCLMIEYEDTSRALEKAKLQKRQAVSTFTLNVYHYVL